MERKREREEEERMPRYTGSRSYRLFLYPEQIIFFVFQRAARLAEALIVTALLSYGSGKLRTVKAFLRQAASRNPPRCFLCLSRTCRVLTKHSKKTDQNWSMLIFLRLRILLYLFPSIYIYRGHPSVFYILTLSFFSSACSWNLNFEWAHFSEIIEIAIKTREREREREREMDFLANFIPKK